MAIFAATEFQVTVGGTDLTDHVTSVELPVSVADLGTTNFSSDGWNENIGGLKSFTVTVNFQQDYAASEVDATLWPLLGTSAAITLTPNTDTVTTTNPQFQFNAIVNDLKPIAATVGDLAVQQVTWTGTGAITRATST